MNGCVGSRDSSGFWIPFLATEWMAFEKVNRYIGLHIPPPQFSIGMVVTVLFSVLRKKLNHCATKIKPKIDPNQASAGHRPSPSPIVAEFVSDVFDTLGNYG